MADKQVDFDTGTTVTAQFLDRLQEFQSAAAWNLRLVISGTSVIIPVGTTTERRVGAVIDGAMRYITASVSVNFSGKFAGTYWLWITTTNDDSIPNFSLVATDVSVTPTADRVRFLGSVYWDGVSTLNTLRQSNPAPVPHGASHGKLGNDALERDSVTPKMLDTEYWAIPRYVGAITGPYSLKTDTGYTGANGLKLYRNIEQLYKSGRAIPGFYRQWRAMTAVIFSAPNPPPATSWFTVELQPSINNADDQTLIPMVSDQLTVGVPTTLVSLWKTDARIDAAADNNRAFDFVVHYNTDGNTASEFYIYDMLLEVRYVPLFT